MPRIIFVIHHSDCHEQQGLKPLSNLYLENSEMLSRGISVRRALLDSSQIISVRSVPLESSERYDEIGFLETLKNYIMGVLLDKRARLEMINRMNESIMSYYSAVESRSPNVSLLIRHLMERLKSRVLHAIIRDHRVLQRPFKVTSRGVWRCGSRRLIRLGASSSSIARYQSTLEELQRAVQTSQSIHPTFSHVIHEYIKQCDSSITKIIDEILINVLHMLSPELPSLLDEPNVADTTCKNARSMILYCLCIFAQVYPETRLDYRVSSDKCLFFLHYCMTQVSLSSNRLNRRTSVNTRLSICTRSMSITTHTWISFLLAMTGVISLVYLLIKLRIDSYYRQYMINIQYIACNC